MLLTSLEGRVERVRPNGTVLENRNRSLPSGGYVMVYTDVTETKRIEAALRQSEQRYALALSGANEGIWEWGDERSEEHTSELQSLMRISYAVFCLKKKTKTSTENKQQTNNTNM